MKASYVDIRDGRDEGTLKENILALRKDVAVLEEGRLECVLVHHNTTLV